MICYYYCHKASGLLANRKQFIFFLRVLFVLGIIAILTIGVIIFIQINIFEDNLEGETVVKPGGIDPSLLCENILFQIYHFFPFVFVAIFYTAFLKIRKKIDEGRTQSAYDKKVQEL